MRSVGPMRRRIMTLVAAASLLAACGSDAANTSDTTSSPAADRPASTATVAIARPAQDQVVRGTEAPLEVTLDGGEIVPQTSTDLQPDQGHLHVILDDELVTMTATTDSTLHDLTPGHHLLKVEFVATDHAPFDPRVIAAVSFQVKP